MRAMNVAMAAIAAVAVGGAATVVGGGSSRAATTTSRTVTVKNGVVQATVSGSGNLEAVKQSDLSFDLAGEITKVYVKEGEKVSEGDVLVFQGPEEAANLLREIVGAPPLPTAPERETPALTELDRAVDILVEMKNSAEAAVGLAVVATNAASCSA